MKVVDIDIQEVKNIKKMSASFPLEKGMYAFVGENGCGKSTLMLALSLIVKISSSKMLETYDICANSHIHISINGVIDNWFYDKGKLTTGKFSLKPDRHEKPLVATSNRMDGFYEGSIFYGSRFHDYNKVNSFLEKDNVRSLLVDADTFVKETLGYILHDNKNYYDSLKKISTKKVAVNEGFKGIPYFIEVNGNLISQYRMSSGESMLISLIDFINNLVIKRRNAEGDILFLIDEVELALHPAAIDRLFIFLDNLIRSSNRNLIVYFSTHSSELIHKILPKNIFYIDNIEGCIDIINPCYPNYAIRNLYIPNGYDFLILVEDVLAKNVVSKVIRDEKLGESKLCCVLPAGGWSQVVKLHQDMVKYNTLGVGKKIISIFDGDIKDKVNSISDYAPYPKTFLPVPSFEKYFYKKCILQKDIRFIRHIGDKYFNIRSLNDIIKDFLNDDRTQNSNNTNGKYFYKILISNLEKCGISEDNFMIYLCDEIFNYEDMSKFNDSLRALIQ